MPAKYRVVVDKDLADLVPGFIQGKRDGLPELSAMLSAGNMDGLRKYGHNLAGAGGGYGFDRLSELGKALENAALAGDQAVAGARISDISDYLGNLEIAYE